MDLSKTNEQAFEWLIERSLVGSTREEREAAGQTDVARLQAALIKQLQAQGYEYVRQVKDEASLLRNLRQQLEALNEVVFSDSELTGGTDTPCEQECCDIFRIPFAKSFFLYLTMPIFCYLKNLPLF
jgi:hypothetical protein